VEEKMSENLKQKIEESDIKPWFADEILISANIKARKNKKGIEKEGSVRLLFLSMTTKGPIAEVVLSRFTAEKLAITLKDSLEKLDKELRNKKLPKQQKIIESTGKEKPGYMG